MVLTEFLPHYNFNMTNIRLLIIEDSPDDAELLALELSRAGLTPDWQRVESDEELRAALSEQEWDAVVSDYSLPGYSPEMALVTLRELGLDLPMLVVSGVIRDRDAIQLMKAGARDFMTKDNLDRLAPALRRELAEAVTRRQRREATRALSDSEARMRGVLESMAEGVYGIDLDGRCTVANPACARLIGYDDPAELIGRDMHRLVHHSFEDGTELPKEQCPIYRVMHEGAPAVVDDQVFWRRDGGYFPVEYRAVPMFEEGRITGAVVSFADITERRVGEARRRRLARIVSASEDFMAFIDRDYVYQAVNDSYVRGFAKPREMIEGHSSAELFGEENFEERIRPQLERALAGERVDFQLNGELPGLAGERWVDVTYLPYRDGDEVTGVVAIGRDVTERQHMEAALERADREWTLAMDSFEDALYLLDTERRLVRANQTFYAITRSDPSWAVGRHITEIIHPEGEDSPCPVCRAQETMRDAVIVMEPDHPDNPAGRPIEVSVKVIRDEAGEPGGILMGIHDLTRARETEARLRRSELRLRRVLETTPMPLGIASLADRSITYLNQKFVDTFGYPLEEVPDLESWYARAYPDTAYREMLITEWEKRVGEAVEQGGEIPALEAEVTCKDGRRRHTVASSSVVGDEVIVLFSDLTERKRMEEELRLAMEHAEAASRAKSEFLAVMSHEIRTPMNAILGMAELLAESERDAERKGYLEVQSRAGSALLDLIDDILDLSRLEAGRVEARNEPFVLAELLGSVCDFLNARAREKGIHLTGEVAEGIPSGWNGDVRRLRQILVNLVGNAVKFTQQGGVTVSVAIEEKGAGGTPWRLRFCVVDTGIGIPREHQETIFDSFTQVDSSSTRAHGGSGLGLSITRRLVDLLGGELWMESSPGEGSLFCFIVPMVAFAGAAPEHVVAEPLPRVTEALRILLAEDSEDNALLIRSYLKGSPHQLDVVIDGEEAVAACEENEYDLILMDIQMPVMDGYAATAFIRDLETLQHRRRTPILALTAYAMKEDEEKSLAAGCDGHITKPIKKAQLLEAIARWGASEPDS